jgi:hypothetical protein
MVVAVSVIHLGNTIVFPNVELLGFNNCMVDFGKSVGAPIFGQIPFSIQYDIHVGEKAVYL